VTIDDSGEWWKGTSHADIATFLKELKPGGYPVNRVIEAACQCSGKTFRVLFDADDELAQTVCIACGREAYIADSEEHWPEASPTPLVCPCGRFEYEVGLGLSLREETWVRWMSLGARCVHCGVLGSPLDWKSDLDLSDPAATRVG